MFVLTDGRPWYKQVVSGIGMCIVGILACLMLLFLITLAVLIVLSFVHDPSKLVDLGLAIMYIIGGVSLLILMGVVWRWATSD